MCDARCDDAKLVGSSSPGSLHRVSAAMLIRSKGSPSGCGQRPLSGVADPSPACPSPATLFGVAARSPPPRPVVRSVEVGFHADGRRSWVAGSDTLAFIASTISDGDRTVETGSGASTVTFAAGGSTHTAISPFESEHVEIRKRCAELGIDAGRVTFFAESRDTGLPRLLDTDRGTVDLAFIDGDHTFPMTAVDFHYADLLLKVGGLLILDDAPIGSVKVVHRFVERECMWRYRETLDNRAVVYEKMGERPTPDNWRAQRVNRHFPDFWYLPLGRRVYLTARAYGSRVKRAIVK